jgi:hypothetical protein
VILVLHLLGLKEIGSAESPNRLQTKCTSLFLYLRYECMQPALAHMAKVPRCRRG